MTARDLLFALSEADCPARAEGEELVFDREPPRRLLPYVELLQTGLRAALTARPWYGIQANGEPWHGTGKKCDRLGTDGILDPSKLVPNNVAMLTVAGDSEWDRVRPKLRDAHADAFRAYGEGPA